MPGARTDLHRLARKLASLSYEDRRRVIAEAQRLEHEHFARVRMLTSDGPDADVRPAERHTRVHHAAFS